MDSIERPPAPAPETSVLKRVLGPRPRVMAGAALCVCAVVIALAQLVMSSQESSRSAVRERFANGAVVRSQLTASLLHTTNASLRAAGAKIAPTTAALDKVASASHLGYVALLSADGRVLAKSSKTPAAVARRLAQRPPYIRQALSGRAWLSDVHGAGKAGTIDWAVPFGSPAGRRVIVEGFPATSLSAFLSSWLSQGSNGRAIYVVDSKRGLIAAAKSATGAQGRLPATIAQAKDLSAQTIDGTFLASAVIGGSGWRLVLAQPTGALYATAGGTASWLLWGMVALAAAIGGAALVPLRRSHVRSAQLNTAHAQLIALNETLEAKVAERTELAERRSQALVRSNAELEQFASVAAHDLQEPLRKIRMYCERIGRRAGEVPEDVGSDLTRMEDAAGRMQNLISDLLDLARVNSRGREMVAVDLNEVAAEVVGDLEAGIAEVGADVVLEPLPVVLGDAVQLRQVLQNLLSNALKFHREGEQLRVRVAVASRDARTCVIAVEDNGIGFDDKYAERIFGTFQRLHGRGQYEGTGIGLSIARKIAWRHEGDISASGVLGEGSTFKLTLRAAPPGAVVPRDERRHAEPANQRSAA